MVPQETEFGETPFAEGGRRFSKPSAALLYKTSPIDDTSTFIHMLRGYSSAAYDWILDCECKTWGSKRGQMLRIERAVNGDETVLKLSGRIDAENVAELEGLFASEAKGRRVTLDLEDLTLASREAVRFLEGCESDSIKLVNCPLYIREWILRERNAK